MKFYVFLVLDNGDAGIDLMWRQINAESWEDAGQKAVAFLESYSDKPLSAKAKVVQVAEERDLDISSHWAKREEAKKEAAERQMLADLKTKYEPSS